MGWKHDTEALCWSRPYRGSTLYIYDEVLNEPVGMTELVLMAELGGSGAYLSERPRGWHLEVTPGSEADSFCREYRNSGIEQGMGGMLSAAE